MRLGWPVTGWRFAGQWLSPSGYSYGFGIGQGHTKRLRMKVSRFIATLDNEQKPLLRIGLSPAKSDIKILIVRRTWRTARISKKMEKEAQNQLAFHSMKGKNDIPAQTFFYVTSDINLSYG